MKLKEIKHKKWGNLFFKELRANGLSEKVVNEIKNTKDPIYSSFLIGTFLKNSELILGEISEDGKLKEYWWVEYKNNVIDSKNHKNYRVSDFCAIKRFSLKNETLKNDDILAQTAYLATRGNEESLNALKKLEILTVSQEKRLNKIYAEEKAEEITKKIKEETDILQEKRDIEYAKRNSIYRERK